MISAEALVFLRGPQSKRPDITIFTTTAEGQTAAIADAFLHVEGGTYNAMAKGVVIGQVSMPREDHGALSEATGLPVHDAEVWSRIETIVNGRVVSADGRGLVVMPSTGAMTGKTSWLDRPPIAQVALADLSAGDWSSKTAEEVVADLGVFERAAEDAAKAIKNEVLYGEGRPRVPGDGKTITERLGLDRKAGHAQT